MKTKGSVSLKRKDNELEEKRQREFEDERQREFEDQMQHEFEDKRFSELQDKGPKTNSEYQALLVRLEREIIERDWDLEETDLEWKFRG